MAYLAAFASVATLLSFLGAGSAALAQAGVVDPATQAGTVVNPAGKVTLNPQPLPPKVVGRDPSTGKAIIIVSGRDRKKWRKVRIRRKPGGSVLLNPQPLPPKAVRAR